MDKNYQSPILKLVYYKRIDILTASPTDEDAKNDGYEDDFLD